jgi:hypothetical protein
MTLVKRLPGFGAATLMLVCAALGSAQSVEAARPTSKHASEKPVKTAARPSDLQTVLGNRLNLSPTTQLAALNAGLKAGPFFFGGRSTGCNSLTPTLTAQPGSVIAGNFRDAGGACYVWLNLQQSELLTGSDLCKIALHEYGHLTGLEHSANPNDVMFSPFRPDPTPVPCQAPPAGSAAKVARKPRRK